MYLTYTLDESGKRVYSLQKLNAQGKPNEVAHPARFSPEDKFSRERLVMKKRYGLLLMSKPKTQY